MSCRIHLNNLFPHTRPPLTINLDNNVLNLFIRSIPSVIALFFIVIFPCVTNIKPFFAKNIALFVGLLASVSIGLNSFQWFDILKCNDYTKLENFRYVVVIGVPIIVLFSIIIARYKRGFFAGVLLFVFSIGVVVAEHFAQAIITNDTVRISTSQLFFNVQLFLSCASLCCLLQYDSYKGKVGVKKSLEGIDFSTFDPTYRHPSEQKSICTPSARDAWG